MQMEPLHPKSDKAYQHLLSARIALEMACTLLEEACCEEGGGLQGIIDLVEEAEDKLVVWIREWKAGGANEQEGET